jgi:hypothetical protein
LDSTDLADIVPQGLEPCVARRVAKLIAKTPELASMPTPDQQAVIGEFVAAEQKRQMVLSRFVTELESNRDILVKARRDTEQRWADDLSQYEGDTRMLPSKEYAADTQTSVETPPKINLTRSRTNTIAARIGDTLFPSDDRNWDMDPEDEEVAPTPPSQPQGGGAVAQPSGPGIEEAPPEDHSKADQQSDAQRACERMRARCDSQMRAAGYTEHGRKMVDQGCLLGTGVLKGPFNVKRRKKRYETQENGVSILKVETVTEPSCAWVDVRYVYLDNATDPARRERVCELHLMTDHEVRKLSSEPGFDDYRDTIKKLLKLPQDARSLGEVGVNLTQWNSRAPIKDDIGGKWAVWEHHVILTREEMQALGMEPDETLEILPPVEVWTCNNEILKIDFDALEGEERLMYHSWNFQQAPDSPYGFGIPYLYRSTQRSLDAEWHMGLYNLSVSSGPQVIYRDGIIKPTDGRFTIRGPKTWRVTTESDIDIDKVWMAKIIPNNADQILKFLELTIQLGDDEINLPAIAQGNTSHAEATASGLIQRMTASTIVQRRIAKSADDNVIRPLSDGFYNWNMLYSTDASIKGNFIVRARGASDLMHKDIIAQHLQVLSQITDNPRYAGYTDDYEFLALMFKTTSVPADQLLWEREKAEANRAKAQEAESQAGQVEQAKAAAIAAEMEYKKLKLELERENAERDDDYRRRDRELDYQEHLDKMRDRENERLLRLTFKDADLDLAANKQVSDEDIARARLRSEETATGLQARLDAEALVSKERKTAMEVRVESPNPRLA